VFHSAEPSRVRPCRTEVLLRLKKLETLENAAEKIDKLTGFGDLERVLEDVVRIQVPSA
jgi:hypothetical protein